MNGVCRANPRLNDPLNVLVGFQRHDSAVHRALGKPSIEGDSGYAGGADAFRVTARCQHEKNMLLGWRADDGKRGALEVERRRHAAPIFRRPCSTLE